MKQFYVEKLMGEITMNLLNKCTTNEIKLIKQAGIDIENKDYSNKEIDRVGIQIMEYIMSHSSKNKDIDRLNNKYSRIFEIIKELKD